MADKAAEKKAAEKDKGEGHGLPEVDVLMKGLLAQPGVEGYMVFNDSGACTMQARFKNDFVTSCDPGSPFHSCRHPT